MALSSLLMAELCKRLTPGARIASMGYPDLIAPEDQVRAILGNKYVKMKLHRDAFEIARWHGVYSPIPDAYSFFELQGAKLDVYDVAAHRGGEIIADLNYPIVSLETYDFVIDVGSLEHCFNIGQAALNMAGLLKAGGVILHENPHTGWGNHGFYSLHPTWYADFYGQRGFKLLECWLVPRGAEPIKDIERTKRFNYNGPEANIIAIAERLEVLPIEFVVQSKYKKMIQKVLPVAGDRAVATTAQGR